MMNCEEITMTREEALVIVREFVKHENLVRHMLAVEAAMAFYAKEYDQDEELWRVTALLHDYDWEIHPSLDEHPQAGIALLEERGVSEEVTRAILSHADHTGVPRQSLMEKALLACDEITGLITASALVRPSRSLSDLKVKSVKKKWKDKSFAAGINREEVIQAVDDFGVELWEHVGNVIQAMQGIAPDLGL
jgi:putative nucleotidyltransferase with HDIG domain